MKTIPLTVVIVVIFTSAVTAAANVRAVDIDASLPVPNYSASSPGNVIGSFYSFALMIGGLLAFGAIVYGGIKYAMAGGNPTAASEGKDWIYQALLGLLLLAGAYIILNTINPNLINLSLPTLSPPQTSSVTNNSTNNASAFNH